MQNLRENLQTQLYRFFLCKGIGDYITLLAIENDTVVKRVRYIFDPDKMDKEDLKQLDKIVNKNKTVINYLVRFDSFVEIHYNDAKTINDIYERNKEYIRKIQEQNFIIAGDRGKNINPIYSLKHYINVYNKLISKWKH